ncbi:hypothetical protein [Caballeronia sp. J97]|uniref:hypothetical protein n=1 Tax=Caballeronia sp. J97 TaxID=2805429 RepID=UPI002AAF4494|nr:hypothetical protein [Caballeronia sp. J97]
MFRNAKVRTNVGTKFAVLACAKNAALVGEAEHSTAELRDQAERLERAVSTFRV